MYLAVITSSQALVHLLLHIQCCRLLHTEQFPPGGWGTGHGALGKVPLVCIVPGLSCCRAYHARSEYTKAEAFVEAARSISSNTSRPPTSDTTMAQRVEHDTVEASVWHPCTAPSLCPCPLFMAQCASGHVHRGGVILPLGPLLRCLPSLALPCGLHQHGAPTYRTQGRVSNKAYSDHWQHQQQSSICELGRLRSHAQSQ